MNTVHIVSSYHPSQAGGLQMWTLDLATALSAAGYRAVVYVCEDSKAAPSDRQLPFEVVEMGPLRSPWEVAGGNDGAARRQYDQERARLTFACVRAEIAKRMGEQSNVILSSFVTTAGFTAHLVAEALDLPHIPVIAGTDLTRGFRNAQERQIILEVCRFARIVVAKSEEQVSTIHRRLPDLPCRVIETSVALPSRRWRKPPGTPVRIFSDGGFSSKKGTGVLLDAFVAVLAQGVAARLEICGRDQPGQEDHWRERRRLLQTDASFSISFPGHLSISEIEDRICSSDIYASATLGEGASAARARALCLGVPMVTTACGELAGAPQSDHLRLTPVADAVAFHDALLTLSKQLNEGNVTVDEAAVERFRDRFNPRREWAEWISLLREVSWNG